MSNRIDPGMPAARDGTSEYTRFVADIGGTHARFALVDNASNAQRRSLVEIKVFNCADFDGPVETVMAYQNYLGHELPDRACIAAAGPVDRGEVHFTNLNWRMSADELRDELDLKQLEIVNDFTAVAHAVSKLTADDTRVILEGSDLRGGLTADGVRVVVGAGTGLGVAALSTVDGATRIIDSECGHTRFAPANAEERELLKILSGGQAFVSIEKLLSGPGIRAIHKAMCTMRGHAHEPLGAEEITTHARNGTRADCVQTVELYVRALGSFCSQLVLTFGARNGVYMVGDIFRSIEPFLIHPNFTERFLDGGAMTDMIERTPVLLVLVEDPGLYGAAYCTIK